MRIALVGCGFLGSIYLEELLKRLYAANRKDVQFRLIDMDEFEERNAANQNCTLRQNKAPKIHVMGGLCESYGFKWVGHRRKLTNESAPLLLPNHMDLIVDALDNLPARHIIYFRAMELSIPSLHLGVDENGDGTVEWIVPPHHDTWHLSPKVLRIFPEADQTKEPPCRLVRMRGVGLNLGLAAAKATTLALKEDIEEYVGEGPQLRTPLYTNWSASNFGHQLEGAPYVQEVQRQKEEAAEEEAADQGSTGSGTGDERQPEIAEE